MRYSNVTAVAAPVLYAPLGPATTGRGYLFGADAMKVYVAVRGLYSSQYVEGVYASPEQAMAANDDKSAKWTATTWAGREDVPLKYRHLHGDRYTTWANNHDWDGAVEIREYEIDDDAPRRLPDKAVRQIYRDKDGGWDYINEP